MLKPGLGLLLLSLAALGCSDPAPRVIDASKRPKMMPEQYEAMLKASRENEATEVPSE